MIDPYKFVIYKYEAYPGNYIKSNEGMKAYQTGAKETCNYTSYDCPK